MSSNSELQDKVQAGVTAGEEQYETKEYPDTESKGAGYPQEAKLKRQLKNRHIAMIRFLSYFSPKCNHHLMHPISCL
jgi:hypothetical protein